jgi:hypothetical protein
LRDVPERSANPALVRPWPGVDVLSRRTSCRASGARGTSRLAIMSESVFCFGTPGAAWFDGRAPSSTMALPRSPSRFDSSVRRTSISETLRKVWVPFGRVMMARPFSTLYLPLARMLWPSLR